MLSFISTCLSAFMWLVAFLVWLFRRPKKSKKERVLHILQKVESDDEFCTIMESLIDYSRKRLK